MKYPKPNKTRTPRLKSPRLIFSIHCPSPFFSPSTTFSSALSSFGLRRLQVTPVHLPPAPVTVSSPAVGGAGSAAAKKKKSSYWKSSLDSARSVIPMTFAFISLALIEIFISCVMEIVDASSQQFLSPPPPPQQPLPSAQLGASSQHPPPPPQIGGAASHQPEEQALALRKRAVRASLGHWSVDALDSHGEAKRLKVKANELCSLETGLRVFVEFDDLNVAIDEVQGFLVWFCG
ncbi:hypothetical protein M9H77_21638 [Catharanthus roseus]|uniref:Uncharacterized protein n=1 Tax=Catharanthus roseus TaxID=4058 RepID=A0ACC0APY8_CATRO|nr:hypothetical protein M9H77_21638 [Catharanthus roseus]